LSCFIEREYFFCHFIVFSYVRPNDEAVAFIVSKIIPDPVGKHEQLVAKTDKERDVNEKPDPPCNAATE